MRAIDVRDIEIDIKGHPGKEPGIDMTFTPSATCFESERWRLYCYVPEKLLGEIESIMRATKSPRFRVMEGGHSSLLGMATSDTLTCREIQEIIRKNGYEIVNVQEGEGLCIVDFRHPKVKVQLPVAWYLSSVVLRGDGSIETTVRSKVEGVKELYLDYCCENGEHVCRPHVDMVTGILSVEAKFRQNPKEKFDSLLKEMR
jgi:hypothetical protein